MSEKLVMDDKGREYIVNEYGEKRDVNFGQSVMNDMISYAPMAMKITSFGYGKLAGVIQSIAKKVLTEEEFSQLEEKQAKTKTNKLNKILPKSLATINEAGYIGNMALLAIGKHFVKKVVVVVKNLNDKNKEC